MFDFDFDFDFDFSPKQEDDGILKLRQCLNECLTNYPYNYNLFASTFLKIQNKAGTLIAFEFNEWQERTFKVICEKYKVAQKLDLLIIKGRQGGLSTFFAGFLFYQMLAKKCNIAFISNNSKNAVNLYNMVERFFFSFPLALKLTSKNSGHKMAIENNSAKFYTAEGDNIRGSTLLGLVNDELGERTDVLELQALAKIDGMAHIKIGTPKGTGNNLYLIYSNLINSGRVEEIIFLPWYELSEYEVFENVEIKEETFDYLKKHNLDNLPIEKKRWLQVKIDELKGSVFNPFEVLNQEYPPNLSVGFEATALNCFCDPYFINLAFEKKEVNVDKVAILGVDVAGGGDKSILSIRKGDYCEFLELKHNPQDTEDFTNKAQQVCNYMINNKNLYYKSINIDATGLGHGFVEIFRQVSRRNSINIKINAVHFSSKVEKKISPFESRNIGVKEFMYFELQKWLMTGKVILQYNKILQDELLATEITSINGEPKLVKKEIIKVKLGHSPDYADALALTFAPEKELITITIRNSH